MTARQAARRLGAGRHNIWELVVIQLIKRLSAR
jgi:hypothetical protein